ncbi:sigma-70 family RNA polymerase sigma factor [Clostridium baratii]|uniref:sigma-70 family RNA polymerase sigma factor n=1 Tax=Clostridium baratii TaxID=1561 RepID=UPI0005F29448|nr:sigma-70 family RNA polymerase sigma factor [Clostridium baratii]AQM58561.1 hypothetical protein NPD11_3075 [Clostridium baratii]KJU70939.1 hypothetical protein UC77_12265 [Clostridium baratii]
MNLETKNLTEKQLIIGAKNGDERMLNQLINDNKNYIYKMINTFKIRKRDVEEAFNCAIVGFIEAIYAYDLSYDTKLIKFSIGKIKGELVNFIRFQASIEHNNVEWNIKQGNKLISKVSLDEIENTITSSFNMEKNLEDKVLVNQLISTLSDSERELIRDIYLRNVPRKKVAEKINLSRSGLFYMEKRTLNTLRKEGDIEC